MVEKSGNLASWFLEVLHGNLTFCALDLTVKTSIQCIKFPYAPYGVLLRLLPSQQNPRGCWRPSKVQVGFPGSLTVASLAGSPLRKILHECTSQ